MSAAKKTAATPAAEETADSKGNSDYVVVAQLIQVAVGGQVLQFRAEDVLPNGIDEDSLAHLLDLGFIAENK